MTGRPRIYLAGPDVFLPDPLGWASRRRAICDRHGIDGVSPLDPLDGEPPDWSALPLPRLIAQRNEAHIRSCRGVVANLTPFRGVSADTGTVYEVGFARTLGLPVWGYSTIATPYAERSRAGGVRGDGRDLAGLEIESFGLADNLMIACGIEESGGALALGAVAEEERWTDLALFERCVALAALGLRA